MATSADGTEVRAYDEGAGPVILVVHAARDDGSAWGKVAARLSDRFRVVRLRRRPYRLDLKPVRPCSIGEEVEDVRAAAGAAGTPAVIVGHSSGAVVALEALVEEPSMFAGAVLYEPPLISAGLLGGKALERAQAAYDGGRPGKALRIFLRDIVRIRPVGAWVVGAVSAVVPARRAYIRPQLDDCAAIDRLGVRLDAYARIEVPAVLLGGSRSPAHLGERLDALARVMPNAERVVLPRQGHHANILGPDAVSRVIASLADKAFG